jgi:hypothetical protein
MYKTLRYVYVPGITFVYIQNYVCSGMSLYDVIL